MSPKRNETSYQRRLRFEQFEKKLVMSAQAVASLLPEMEVASPAVTQQVISLEDSATTQAANIAAQYGFDGSGQTVAVIDSGIAWDHYALGNGYGEGNKVVGGWDFAENDDNPYDDGPAGYHGSHVAGIIGSTDDQYRGVSSGVDLVSLRVFDDRGAGDLAWVEQALQWVHDHKDDFANPITTVNLSLGTDWNADTMPEWATLEEEFAQLEADGLFISVAAGNAFHTFGEAGLSYPAVSDFVVPVTSHDADGKISDFAQRDDGVLAAPGEAIRSTVPDHLFGGMSGGQFLGSTGTSMAAPYVAGASAVLRQANEFMGVAEVTQDMLYQQFRETADQVYDAVTGGYFYKINLDAALAAVVTDLHSDAVETATDAGALEGGETIEGTIGKIADVDTFEFTAAHSGKMTLNFEVTDNLVPLVDVVGVDSVMDGHRLTFDVVAGQKYNFAVATAEGTGHYKVRVGVQISNTGGETNAGGETNTGEGNNTGSETNSGGETNTGEETNTGGTAGGEPSSGEETNPGSEITTGEESNTGEETSAGNETNASEETNPDSENNPEGESKSGAETDAELGTNPDGEPNAGEPENETGPVEDTKPDPIDWGQVTSGEFLNLSVDGESTYELTASRDGFLTVESSTQSGEALGIEVYDSDMNLIHSTTSQNGQIRLDVEALEGESFVVKAIGKSDAVDFRVTNLVSLEDGRLTVHGTDQDDHIAFSADGDFSFALNGVEYHFDHAEVNRIQVIGHSGSDTIELALADDDDRVNTRKAGVFAVNQRYQLIASGFSVVNISGGGGNDQISMTGSRGNDLISAGDSSGEYSTVLSGSKYRTEVSGFELVHVKASGGNDSAVLNGTSGNDTFVSRGQRSTLEMDGAKIMVDGQDSIVVTGGGGNDTANLYDSAGNDKFVIDRYSASITNDTYEVSVDGMSRINAYSNSGTDSVTMHDSVGNDTFYHRDGTSVLRGTGYQSTAHNFADVDVISSGGRDVAQIFDTVGNDTFYGDANTTEMVSGGLSVGIDGFKKVNLIANKGGFDRAFLSGTEGKDIVMADSKGAQMAMSNGQSVRAVGMDETEIDTRGGIDLSFLTGSRGHDELTASYSQVELETTLNLLRMTNMEHTHFDGNGGGDEVSFEEVGEFDLLESLGGKAKAYLQDHTVTAKEFSNLEASTVDDAIAQYDLEAVDYRYMLRGKWAKK